MKIFILFILFLMPVSGFAEKSIFDAVEAGDLAFIKSFSGDINATNYYGSTPLIVAAAEGYAEVVKALLAAHADIHATNKGGQNALMNASGPEVVKSLVQAGLDVNEKDRSGNTPLILAVNMKKTDTVKALIELHAEVNTVIPGGWTPLLFALKFKAPTELIKLLLDAGVNVNVTNKFNETPLSLATLSARDDVTTLLKNSGVSMPEYYQLFDMIGKPGDIDFIQNYKGDIDVKNESGMTALMLAASEGNLNALKALISAKADVNAKDKSGMTAMMYAAINGSPDVVRELSAAHADANLRDSNRGMTAFMYAAGYMKTNVFPALVEAKADIDARDNSGKSVLMYGVGGGVGNIELAKALIPAGVTMNEDTINVLRMVRGVEDLHLYTNIFNADMKSLQSLGFDTNSFPSKTFEISCQDRVLRLIFPENDNVKDVSASMNIMVLQKRVYLDNFLVASNQNGQITADIHFPYPGTYNLVISFQFKNKTVSPVHYLVTAMPDSIVDFKTDNIPVFPSPYFYRTGLQLKSVSQRYLYYTVQKEWGIGIAGATNFTLSVHRPGVNFRTNNITVRRDFAGTAWTVRFPETGVYMADFKDAKGDMLLRYKIRCVEASKEAETNTPAVLNWPDSNPDLRLTQWVFDIPFEWEMDFRKLVDNLRAKAADNDQLVEMFYDWLTQNAYYDFFLFNRSEKKTGYSAGDAPILGLNFDVPCPFYRVLICSGYSGMMELLCSKAGLESYMVFGTLESLQDVHAWTAIKAAGAWKFLDTTWGIYLRDPFDFMPSRYVTGIRRFARGESQPQEDYELGPSSDIPNRIAILFNKLSKADTYALPVISPSCYFAEMGFKLETLSHRKKRFVSGKTLTMTFPAPAGYDFKPIVFLESNPKAPRPVQSVSYADGQYVLKIDFPGSGTYSVSANFGSDGKPKMSTQIQYDVTVNQGGQ
jgi:ankyrin repeat protein